MRYSVSAGRVKLFLWAIVILQIFFSISVIEPVYIFHTSKMSLIQTLFYWFNMIAPIFLLWAFYQTKKQNNNLFLFSFSLSLALVLIRLISMFLHFSLLPVFVLLLYLDTGMFFRSKITKTLSL